MTSSYTSQAGLIFNNQEVFFVSASKLNQIKRIQEPHVPGVLEIFTHNHSLAEAHRAYETARQTRSTSVSTFSNLIAEMVGAHAALLLVNQKVFVCAAHLLEKVYALMIDPYSSPQTVAKIPGIRDLTTMSKTMPFVAASLQKHFRAANAEYPPLTFEQFRTLAERLSAENLLTVPIGAIDFGDFKRQIPICPQFGNLRGSPIDRYYLDKFIEAIHNEIKGVTLEIAGDKANPERFKLRNVTSYATLNLEGEDADIIADAHDPKAVNKESLDTVILFNVLEHCERPWVVVDNIYNWLKPGGQVFCMVPSAQRVHRQPQDYWRIFPDAMNSLFVRFPRRKLYVYGNPLTTLAAYYGIAHEELSREELDYYHEDYPVANCIHAQKA